VISPFIGQTNFLSVHRVLGTILGACTATGAYLAFHDYPVALAFFGFVFSLPCFYYIVSMPEYAASGRFVLLTYNLTCLYW
jgi:Fusaric acid resistance protein-like